MARIPSLRSAPLGLFFSAIALVASGCGGEANTEETPTADTASTTEDVTTPGQDTEPPQPDTEPGSATPDVVPGDDEPDIVSSDGSTEPPEPDIGLPREGEADTTPDVMGVEWPVGDCADQPAGTGVEVGQIAFDVEMMDQFGQMVRLHDFCDRTVLLVGSAFWCGGCIDKAPTLDAIYQAHRDAGLMIITLLTETLDNAPCTQEDLEIWATEYGQTFPVLSDVDGYIHTFTPKKDSGKLPMEILLGPGMEILTVISDVTEADLIAALPGS